MFCIILCLYTEQKKTQNLIFEIYQKPIVKKEIVRTWYYRDNRTRGFFEQNQYHHHYLIQFDEIIEPGVEIKQINTNEKDDKKKGMYGRDNSHFKFRKCLLRR